MVGGGGIRPMAVADLAEVARVHCAVLAEGFLARLGPVVLTHVYAGALTAPGAVGLVADDGRGVGGFLLATAGTGALFRHILLRRSLALAPLVLRAIVREPGVLGRMVETLRYPARRRPISEPTGGDAELIAIALLPDHRSQGYGRAMVDALNQTFRARGVRSYAVSVYASNARANGFYRDLGFELAHDFSMYGRPWRLYRRRLLPERESIENQGQGTLAAD